jgi:hypothetical protein
MANKPSKVKGALAPIEEAEKYKKIIATIFILLSLPPYAANTKKS